MKNISFGLVGATVLVAVCSLWGPAVLADQPWATRSDSDAGLAALNQSYEPLAAAEEARQAAEVARQDAIIRQVQLVQAVPVVGPARPYLYPRAVPAIAFGPPRIAARRVERALSGGVPGAVVIPSPPPAPMVPLPRAAVTIQVPTLPPMTFGLGGRGPRDFLYQPKAGQTVQGAGPRVVRPTPATGQPTPATGQPTPATGQPTLATAPPLADPLPEPALAPLAGSKGTVGKVPVATAGLPHEPTATSGESAPAEPSPLPEPLPAPPAESGPQEF